jgi:succinyl-diaminopimelate desuccinylase
MGNKSAELNILRDVVSLTEDLINFPSESRNEQAIADSIESQLLQFEHLEVLRDGNTVIARTDLGRAERVVIAGHIDTVPSSGNDVAVYVKPGAVAPVADVDGSTEVTEDRIYGLGACDMKAGVAIALHLAAKLTNPTRDVTWVFYDCEEIEATHNGLKRIVENHPDWLEANFAVLMEPSNGGVEAGCQGTMRIEVSTRGRRAHTARSWMGSNAIHATAEILNRLNEYEPARVIIDELEYREGLQAVGIAGGVAGNVVPDWAKVTINHRFAPNRSAAEAEQHLREIFEGFDLEVVDVVEGALPGLERPAAKAFVDAVGSAPKPKFGWTDVARFSRLGIPAVNFGPANAIYAHAPNEFVPVAQIKSIESGLSKWLQS